MIEYNKGVSLNLALLFSGNRIPRLVSLLHVTCVYTYIRVHSCVFVEKAKRTFVENKEGISG